MLHTNQRVFKKIFQISAQYQHTTDSLDLTNTSIMDRGAYLGKADPDISASFDAFDRLTILIQNTELYKMFFPMKHIIFKNVMDMRLYKTIKKKGKAVKDVGSDVSQDICVILQPKIEEITHMYRKGYREQKDRFNWLDSNIANVERYQSLDMICCPNGYFTKGLEEGRVLHTERSDSWGSYNVTIETNDPEGCPPTQIYLTKPFFLAKTQITSGLYCEIMGLDEIPWKLPGRGYGEEFFEEAYPRFLRPISSISWLDAIRFCNRLSEIKGLDLAYREETDSIGQKFVIWNENANGYRLPTAFEWESAAKADNPKAIYSGASGKNSTNVAWTQDNSEEGQRYNKQKMFKAVATKDPNNWNFYDLTGNVNEMTQTLWNREEYLHGIRMYPSTTSANNSLFLNPQHSFVDGVQEQDHRILVGIEPNSILFKELERDPDKYTYIVSTIILKGGSYADDPPRFCNNAHTSTFETFEIKKDSEGKLICENPKALTVGFRVARNVDF